jgi:hypothetical protein
VELLHADGRGRGEGGVAPELDQEVGRTTDDIRCLHEVFRAVDHPEEPQDALHAGQAAELVPQSREHVQRGELRRRVSLLECELAPDLADVRELVIA